MTTGNISDWRNLPDFAGSAVWTRAFEWLENKAATAAVGKHSLGSDGFTADVAARALKNRDDAKIETHAHTIDIHFVIEGAEAIELGSRDELTPLGDYDAQKDTQFYVRPPKCAHRIENRAWNFLVIMPNEAHMAALELPGHDNVRKVVIKLPVALLSK